MSARILVVDDLLPNIRLLEVKLTAEYYDVVTASNGEEALEKAKSLKLDLIPVSYTHLTLPTILLV